MGKGKKKMKISKADEAVFNTVVTSQYSSELYKRLVKDRRLDKFIDILSLCGAQNMSMSKACEVITKAFPSYIKQKKMDVRTLESMIDFYPELEDAWTFNKDVYMMRAFKAATNIMLITDKMADIKDYHEMYDSGTSGIYIREDKKGKELEVNVDIHSKETKKTLNKLYSELEDLEEPEDLDGDEYEET